MTTGERTVEAIRQALEDNRAEPEGQARNARAEALAEEAERTGDRPLLIEALFNLLTAYNYSSESDKKFVPFARALRMWDENAADFDEFAAHSLHWYFKWVSSGMLDQPHIPLAAIEKWQAEMEHRYRLAGHSERAVRQGEFRIARHIGDTPRAERAFAAWQSAERDVMSDCQACELHLLGGWLTDRGRDEEALESWAPVLDGELTCAHEPHAVLASSLLPLVRLGRLDEARANHLRGYRMVRTMESMRTAVAKHVEFCALTGNEPRALEILADQPRHFTATGDPDSLMDHLAATALATGRVTALGHPDLPVPGPAGRSWTAAELHVHARDEALALAVRFDRRNGTTAVTDAVRARLGQLPLLDRLPLGVRTARLAAEPAAEAEQAAGASALDGPHDGAAAAPGGAGPARDDVPALVAEARRLSDGGHPRAHEAWTAVETAAARTGAPLDDLARAEITDHAGMTAIGEPERSAALFRRAAEEFEQAGETGEAAACRTRAAYAQALAGDVDGALHAADDSCARLRTLHGLDRASAKQLTGALLLRCRILLHAALTDPARQHEALAAAEEQAAQTAELSTRMRLEPGMTGRLADATVLLGRFAADRGENRRAIELLDSAARLHLEAGQPWYAAEPEAALADLCLGADDPAAAARHAAAALDHGRDILLPPQRAQLHMIAAQAHAALGDDDDACRHALRAAQCADDAGDGLGLGAGARLLFGGALRRLGRAAEGAAVLESVLPDLEKAHGEGEVVQARWWLAECHLELGEPRDAAEQFARAARIAEGWDDPYDHAMLANLAADALRRAGLDDDAVRAYARAEDLWRTVGDPHAVVRTLRARAWIELHDDRPGLPTARPYMAAAVTAAQQALAEVGPVGGESSDTWLAAARLRAELADTYRQFAEILIRTAPQAEPRDAYREALVLADRALGAVAPLGDAALDDRTAAHLLAAWLESALGRPAQARERTRAVTAAYDGVDTPTAATRRAQAEALAAHLEAGAGE